MRCFICANDCRAFTTSLRRSEEPNMSKRLKRLKRLIWIAPAAIVGIAVFIAIGGEVVMLLWNWLAPALFGWRQITFWQAIGLLALCRILFGGTGVTRNTTTNVRRRMAERWEQMTPEE